MGCLECAMRERMRLEDRAAAILGRRPIAHSLFAQALPLVVQAGLAPRLASHRGGGFRPRY